MYIYEVLYTTIGKKIKEITLYNKMSRYTGVQITITDTNIEYSTNLQGCLFSKNNNLY